MNYDVYTGNDAFSEPGKNMRSCKAHGIHSNGMKQSNDPPVCSKAEFAEEACINSNAFAFARLINTSLLSKAKSEA